MQQILIANKTVEKESTCNLLNVQYSSVSGLRKSIPAASALELIMNAIISRRRVSVPGRECDGKPVISASIVKTAVGFDAVLILKDDAPIVISGQRTDADAVRRLFELLDDDSDEIPFLGQSHDKPKPSRAKATVLETRTSGPTPRHHGSVEYVITGKTEGQIMYQVRKLQRCFQGYGLLFGELETVDGVLTIRGHRSGNCE